MPRVALTDKMIAGLTSEGKVQRDLYDAVVPGLILRVTAEGTKVWTIRYSVGKERKRATLGRHPAIGLAVARDKATILMRQAVEGEDPMASDGTVGTLLDVSKEFRRIYIPILADTTQKEWRRIILGTIEPKLGTMDLERPATARKQLRSVLDGLASRHAARTVYAIVRRMLRWAGQRDLIVPGTGAQIFSDFARPEIGSARRTRTLSWDETRAILAAVRKEPFLLRGLWRLAWLTGQRRSEVLSAEWSGVDLKEKTWTLAVKSSRRQRVEGKTLGGRTHTLPLSDQAVELLRELRIVAGESPWVFPGEGEMGHVWGVGKSIERVRAASQIREFRIHDIRRTVASRLAELGVGQPAISSILAHSASDSGAATVTSEVYVHYRYLREMRDGLQRWADVLDEKTGR